LIGYLWSKELGQSPLISSADLEETPSMGVKGVGTNSFDSIGDFNGKSHGRKGYQRERGELLQCTSEELEENLSIFPYLLKKLFLQVIYFANVFFL
jgi:hypothetical protein